MTWPERPEADPVDVALPLAGLRVLDLSRIVAGPFAAMILGDLGADVVKVERPGEGDEPRRWGPPFHGTMSAYFLAINRNRRSLTLNLATEEGREIAAGLAGSADVVFENYLPAQAERLGLNVIRESSPAVWVSIRAAGSDGPDGAKPGVDAAAQARSGLMSINGQAGFGPTKMGIPIVDIVSGLYGAIAALAGVRQRPAHPEALGAARFEVPLLEAGVTALMNQAANYLVSGDTPQLSGNDHPNIVPYGPFPTADGQVFLGATSDLQFERLCRMLERDDLARAPEFATNGSRLQHRDVLNSTVGEATRTATTRHWLTLAEATGVLAAPVNNVAQALDGDPQITSIDLVDEVTTAAGPVRLVGSPILVDGRRPPIRTPPPEVGQHTDAILASLGYGPDRILDLHRRGIC